MKTQFIDLAQQRRSIYALGRNVTQTSTEISALIKAAIKYAPTPFNNQSTRAVILFGQHHEQLWQIVHDQLQAIVPAEAFKATEQKIAGFAAAYGTVLFFTDTAVVDQSAADFATYAANFADWAEQAQGGAQYAVWTALAENGLGANLQHYNPLIDADVQRAFGLPTSWQLRAEMDFGSIEAPAGDKTFMADDDRFLVRD